MQTEKSPLEGKTKVAFGQLPANQRVALPILLAIAGTTMLFFLDGTLTKFSDLVFVSNSTLVGYGLLFGLRQSVEIDFDKQVYYIHGRSNSEVKSSGGRLTDIRGISVTRVVYSESFSMLAYLEFFPEANQEAYRIDNLPCSLSGKETREKMLLYLALAKQLNVPLHDDSGWNGYHTPLIQPQKIVVQPGETHPALLQTPPTPKKWNKW